MPDEVDRDQEFNEQQLETMIAHARSVPTNLLSLFFCRQCGEAIPEKGDGCCQASRCALTARLKMNENAACD